MHNACELANIQETEFKARCQLWGLAPGSVHLERGDFLTKSYDWQSPSKSRRRTRQQPSFYASTQQRLGQLIPGSQRGMPNHIAQVFRSS